jgi:DNA-binding CsgD family transcriptional regulator
VLDGLVVDALAGRSHGLVLRGEAGIGKTALLDYLAERASGCRVLRACGIESEMDLAFAGLHQLGPVLDPRGGIPGPQSDALNIAFGLQVGAPPDRFLVGLAMLNLLARAAEDRPLVCLIDDAQWFDQVSLQGLAFVARRLLAEQVVLVFAVRDAQERSELAGLPEMVVSGLPDADARALLSSVIRGPLDPEVRHRILAETRGNPLALLELPRGLTPAELAGGFGLPEVLPMASRIELGFLRRLEPLPDDTRQLLLVAAVEPRGDVNVLWRVATRMGISVDAAAAADASGLVEFGAQVRFRHPLVRSAVCRAAGERELQRVHTALAEQMDPLRDPDRRAWHRARAVAGPDEEVAAALEQSAARAQSRGGVAAAASFLQRSVELTPDPGRRGERALAAAQAAHLAGAPETALALLATAEGGTHNELHGARVELLRAQIAFTVNQGSDSPPLLLKAAARLETLDVALARNTYRDAMLAASFAGRFAEGTGMVEVARAERRAPRAAKPARKDDLLLDGRAVLFTEGYRTGMPMVSAALEAFCAEDVSTGEDPVAEGLRWLRLATLTAADVWDFAKWEILADRHLAKARDAGAFGELPLALSSRAFVHLFAGELAAAASLIEEARVVIEAGGGRYEPHSPLGLAAWRGRRADAGGSTAPAFEAAIARGQGRGVAFIHYLNSILHNGLGQYVEALDAASQASTGAGELSPAMWALAELVEAATRCDQRDLAADALQRLALTTRESGSDWGLGIEARCRALVDEGADSEALYLEAIERLARTPVRVELARAHLLYGEWLRRGPWRAGARKQLRTAHQMFAAMGAEGFADRARRELLATGGTVRTRDVETREELTPQEAQIARLAAAGRTNPEIGAELFLSARTVEWHLGKVYPKLGVTSRKELNGALAGPGPEASITARLNASGASCGTL